MKFLIVFLMSFLAIMPVHAEDNPEPKLDSNSLRHKLATGDGQTLSWAAKHVIPDEEFRNDWNSIFLILFRAGDGSKALSRLVRYRLSRPGPGEQADPRFQIAFAAAQISQKEKRQEFIYEKLKMLKNSSEEALQEFVSKNREIRAPAGYRIAKPFLGSGKTSIVHLIEKLSDGTVIAWKIPSNDRVEKSYAFRDEVSMAKKWNELDLSTMDVSIAPDGKSLFKTYILGKTLRDLILDGSIFKKREPAHAALSRFIEKMVRKKIAVRGLNAENLILNERTAEFEIIDGGWPVLFDSEEETFEHLQKTLTDKWTRLSMGLADKRDEIVELFATFKSEIKPSTEAPFRTLFCQGLLGGWD